MDNLFNRSPTATAAAAAAFSLCLTAIFSGDHSWWGWVDAWHLTVT